MVTGEVVLKLAGGPLPHGSTPSDGASVVIIWVVDPGVIVESAKGEDSVKMFSSKMAIIFYMYYK